MKLNVGSLRTALKNLVEGVPGTYPTFSLPKTVVKGTTVYPKGGGGMKSIGRKLTAEDLRKTMMGG